jgi:biotin carboxyl carrier protein
MEEINVKKFNIDDTEYETTFPAKFLKRKAYQKEDKRVVTAVIPGLIEKLYVEKGSVVKAGDKLLILEAMKMKNDITAPVAGEVTELVIKEGSVVSKNELLLKIG